MKKRLRITVQGRVQAVGFRYSAKRLADKLGLSGQAANQPDGSLEIEVEGDASQLEEFLA